MARKKGTSTKQTTDSELLNHIQHLSLTSIEEYRQWCVQNGFQNQIRKTQHQRRGELSHNQTTVAIRCLKQKKQEKRNIVDKLSVICSTNVNASMIEEPLLRQICGLYFSHQDVIDRTETVRKSFLKLVSHLYCCKAKFFEDAPAITQWNYYQGTPYLDALVFIAREARSWVRPIEEWRPSSSNSRRQFASLLRHLFVEYQMPLFFDSVWLMNSAPASRSWRNWYLDVGRGQNIRHCRLPISYTKKMAHHFMRAPQELTVQQAIRWGQIIGMGGNASLAQTILATRIGVGFSRDEFWSTVIHWFIQHPQLDRIQIRPLVDYFIFQRFGLSTEGTLWKLPLVLLSLLISNQIV